MVVIKWLSTKGYLDRKALIHCDTCGTETVKSVNKESKFNFCCLKCYYKYLHHKALLNKANKVSNLTT